MLIEYSSESRIDIKLPNGKSILVFHTKKSDEVVIHFVQGKRTLKEMQNRSDGHSSATFTKAEE